MFSTASPARSGVVVAPPVDGRRRRRTRQRQPERLADRAHRVGGEHAAAGALAGAGVLLDGVQLVLGDGAGRARADGLEHARDVERLAVEVAGQRGAVVDEHAGRFSRAIAIIIPGIDLSQPPVATRPSSRSACITASTESAMTSRLTSEARIPS
jgi:hypothetical protein